MMISGFNIARVSQLDNEKGLVKVEYPDYDNMVSPWLGLIEGLPLPAIGQMVGVDINNKMQGVCIGALYTEKNMIKPYMLKLDDDAYIKYDKGTKTLTLKAQNINIVRNNYD